MWSKLGFAHAQHWWTQGSKEKTGGERGAFQAALCSYSLGWGPAKPYYPKETVLSADKCCAKYRFSIQNLYKRPTGNRSHEGGHLQEWKAQTRRGREV